MNSLAAYDSGNTVLVEQCKKISINQVLDIIKHQLKLQLVDAQLQSQGLNIELTTSKTSFNGERIWFKCPKCCERKGVLYQHPVSNDIGCKDCLNLEYKSRRYKGMIEDINLH